MYPFTFFWKNVLVIVWRMRVERPVKEISAVVLGRDGEGLG